MHSQPDQLEGIKQAVRCEHEVTWYQPEEHFGWRFVHDGQDSFDLLPQYEPTEEVTAWLNAVCQQDNLELWLVGVPREWQCEADYE